MTSSNQVEIDNEGNSYLVTEYIQESHRIEEDSIYSAKGHYNAAAIWRWVHLWIGIPNTILAAVAGVSAFANYPVFAGFLTVVVAALSAIATFLNPSERESIHKKCAGEYHALRNQSRIFRNITTKRLSNSIDDLNAAFECLIAKRDDLNATSPQIPKRAFHKARQGIEEGEATYKEDKS